MKKCFITTFRKLFTRKGIIALSFGLTGFLTISLFVFLNYQNIFKADHPKDGTSSRVIASDIASKFSTLNNLGSVDATDGFKIGYSNDKINDKTNNVWATKWGWDDDKVGGVTQINAADGEPVKHLNESGKPATNFDTGGRPQGVAVDNDGNVWTANAGSCNITKVIPAGVIIKATGILGQDLTKYSYTYPSADSGCPRAIAIDKDGFVWVGTNISVYKLSPSTGQIIGSPYSLQAPCFGIAADRNGNVWATSASGGSEGNLLKIPNNGTPTSYKVDSLALGVAVDAEGFVWIASDSGVAKVDPTTGKVVPRVDPSTGQTAQKYWFGNSSYTAVAIDNDGNVWLAGNEGALRINPKTDERLNVILCTGRDSSMCLTPRGISVSSGNIIWVSGYPGGNMGANTGLAKIDALTGKIIQLFGGCNMAIGDMTGYALQRFVLRKSEITDTETTSAIFETKENETIALDAPYLNKITFSAKIPDNVNIKVHIDDCTDSSFNCDESGKGYSSGGTDGFNGELSMFEKGDRNAISFNNGEGFTIQKYLKIRFEITKPASTPAFNIPSFTINTYAAWPTQPPSSGGGGAVITNTNSTVPTTPDNPTASNTSSDPIPSTTPNNPATATAPATTTTPATATVAPVTNGTLPPTTTVEKPVAPVLDGVVKKALTNDTEYDFKTSTVINPDADRVVTPTTSTELPTSSTCDSRDTRQYDTITVDKLGNAWAAGITFNEIVKISPSGDVLGCFESGGEGPFELSTDSLNNVWVVNRAGKNVSKLNNNGKLLGTFDAGDMPFGITIDGKDNVWITNQNNDTQEDPTIKSNNFITKLDNAGKLLAYIRVYAPSFIAYDSMKDRIWYNSYASTNLCNIDAKSKMNDVSTICYTTRKADTREGEFGNGITFDKNTGDIWSTIASNGVFVRLRQVKDKDNAFSVAYFKTPYNASTKQPLIDGSSNLWIVDGYNGQDKDNGLLLYDKDLVETGLLQPIEEMLKFYAGYPSPAKTPTNVLRKVAQDSSKSVLWATGYESGTVYKIDTNTHIVQKIFVKTKVDTTTTATTAITKPTPKPDDTDTTTISTVTPPTISTELPANGTCAPLLKRSYYAVATDKLDNAWFSSYSTDEVVKVNSNGDVLACYNSGGKKPTGIAIDSNNNIWVVNTNSRNVVKLDNSGKQILVFNVGGTSPYGIAIDGGDNVWVANMMNKNNIDFISKLDNSGNLIFKIDSTSPSGIIYDSYRNQIWFNLYNNHQICSINTTPVENKVKTCYPIKNGSSISGITIDITTKDIWSAVATMGTLVRLSENNTNHSFSDTYFGAYTSTQPLIDKNGNLWVAYGRYINKLDGGVKIFLKDNVERNLLIPIDKQSANILGGPDQTLISSDIIYGLTQNTSRNTVWAAGYASGNMYKIDANSYKVQKISINPVQSTLGAATTTSATTTIDIKQQLDNIAGTVTAPTKNQLINSNQITTEDKITINGAATPGASINLVVHSPVAIEKRIVADMYGNWSVTLDQTLTPGSHIVQAAVLGENDTLSEFKTIAKFNVVRPIDKKLFIYFCIGTILIILLLAYLIIRRHKSSLFTIDAKQKGDTLAFSLPSYDPNQINTHDNGFYSSTTAEDKSSEDK
ncbi:MAG: hypothetical protein WCO23_03250 [bacterium]